MNSKQIVLAASGLVLLFGISIASASEITGTLSAGGGSSVTGTVIGAPTATPAPGTYADPQSVTLAADGSSSIRYTIDGTTPTCAGAGLLYTGAITISTNTTILAVSCYSSGASSGVGTYAYTISPSGSLSGTVSTSSAGTLSGTVTSSPGGSLTGTVVAPASSGGGGGGGGGGGNGPIAGSIGSVGGGGGSVIPTGGGGSVLGASTGPTTPGVPNTGAGGNALETIIVLFSSALIALEGMMYLKERHSA